MGTVIEINKRHFGIYEFGKNNGQVVFYFHGFPGSSLDGFLFDFDSVANELELRIIAIDRPGIGNSDFQTNRKLIDWINDVSSIADYLGIDTFSVLGLSGGAPYALVTAFGLPKRIVSTTVVSGMGPMNYNESNIGTAMLIPKMHHFLRRIIVWFMKKGIENNPEKFQRKIVSSLPDCDIKYLTNSSKVENILTLFREAFKQGLKGFLHEAKIYHDPWGFDIKEVKSEVFLWHGSFDKNVDIQLAKRMALELPNCKSRFIEKEGHFSLAGKYLKEILTEIKEKF